MASKPSKLVFTIGYEGLSIEQVLSKLREARVETLLDVRYRAQSRKSGFSKTKLGDACQSSGISYRHDRELGTPPELMKRVRASGYDHDLHTEYRSYLAGKTASLRVASKDVISKLTCLLCYEADPTNCHRSIVAEELALLTGATIRHL